MSFAYGWYLIIQADRYPPMQTRRLQIISEDLSQVVILAQLSTTYKIGKIGAFEAELKPAINPEGFVPEPSG